MAKLSVLIACYNSANVIELCLQSVRWADEVVVCDSHSTDGTLKICRQYTDRIIQHSYRYAADQKNWAIPQCQYEWILILDSDEVLEEGLREEILSKIGGAPPEVAGYRIPRKNFVYGKWLRHGGLYPDLQTRLFRRGRGLWEDREVHEHMCLDGEAGVLDHAILHNGFKDISTWFVKSNRYLEYEASEYTKRGKGHVLIKSVAYPAATFLKQFFWDRGFLDGWRGFLICVLQSFYHFMIYAKLWERSYKIKKR